MEKTIIIAEAGVNHNGDINIAKELICAAHENGADIVKFQLFKTEDLSCKNAPKANYQKKLTNREESQYDMLKKLELNKSQIIDLKNECMKYQIEFLCTAFDFYSLQILREIDLKRYKIPSGEITNYPLLKEIGKTSKPIILSTGMSNLSDIDLAINTLEASGTEREQITLLHCTTEYPAPFEEVNLKAIKTLQKAFKTSVGYSDHTKGISIPLAAVTLGACILEKHFTLDKYMDGPDHKASLEPHEFKNMVQSIRLVEQSLGDGIKRPSKSEIKNIKIARKSIVASREIKKGELLSSDNITLKRPGDGLSPFMWNNLIGKSAKKAFKKDEQIQL